MNVFVQFNTSTLCCQFDEPPSGAKIREFISSAHNIDSELFYLRLDGRILTDRDFVSAESSMMVRADFKLLGGKGGFGAMLKSLAKRSGAKKTTDFGACRDLSGRRLRHVNDDMILNKWKVCFFYATKSV
jgi:hypothetical protein